MDNTVGQINNFLVLRLTKEFAKKHIIALTALANQIPLIKYTLDNIIAESKEERLFLKKWEHSLVVVHDNQPIACLIAYERKAESNDQYPENSIYISELAVDSRYQKQGIAKSLLHLFFKINTSFRKLDGSIIYTVQTNAAPWNKHVRDLYISFGFQPTGKKQYSNRTDMIFTKR